LFNIENRLPLFTQLYIDFKWFNYLLMLFLYIATTNTRLNSWPPLKNTGCFEKHTTFTSTKEDLLQLILILFSFNPYFTFILITLLGIIPRY
jgi:hypothetical protein